ncbi:MAG: SpoIID/LytB domain-containing protein [Bacteriovoracaceae bacterium]|nr:SpoIID/LytB domain-containing protein [Bacteroidota bacterium]
MISSEPVIKVGVIERYPTITGMLRTKFKIANDVIISGEFHAMMKNGEIVLYGGKEIELLRGMQIIFTPVGEGEFTLHDVIFGINFHWERKEHQTFQGALRLIAREEGITAINEVSVEQYLASVISSEMSASAPMELLKAHAITSRSWLVAMLEMKKKFSTLGIPSQRTRRSEEELVRYYDREDHEIFDVCADDHCQRYQGITKDISNAAQEAIRQTRGTFLVHNNEICDARFSKSCGGISEPFHTTWSETPFDYLQPVPCSATHAYAPLQTEQEAKQWILSSPEAFCNTTDGNILRQILPSFDQETTDFFRWSVTYSTKELSELIAKKSGIDFGTVQRLIPVQRGPSGRITRLKIEGTKKTLIVGKELEIRRWLSPSHLYSSAFDIQHEKDRFILRGGGWGHGVGLCQIGAAVMAVKGYASEEIVKHYFRNAELQKLY